MTKYTLAAALLALPLIGCGTSSPTGGSPAANSPTVVDDKPAFQGKWEVVDGQHEGGPPGVPPDMTFEFVGDTLNLIVKMKNGKSDEKKYGFKLDGKQSPKAFDLLGTANGEQYANLGIYELKDGGLRLCVHLASITANGVKQGKRPTAFDATQGSYFVLKSK